MFVQISRVYHGLNGNIVYPILSTIVLSLIKREGAVVTLFETKTKVIQLKKRVPALKFGMTVALKRYNMKL